MCVCACVCACMSMLVHVCVQSCVCVKSYVLMRMLMVCVRVCVQHPCMFVRGCKQSCSLMYVRKWIATDVPICECLRLPCMGTFMPTFKVMIIICVPAAHSQRPHLCCAVTNPLGTYCVECNGAHIQWCSGDGQHDTGDLVASVGHHKDQYHLCCLVECKAYLFVVLQVPDSDRGKNTF